MSKKVLAAEYKSIVDKFPRHIPFPIIHRPYRSGVPTLAAVKAVEDLPSRLVFGDLLADSFKPESNGWSVEYRDGFGNGLYLSVEGDTFGAISRFLGKESYSSGAATNEQAFQQLMSLSSEGWDRVLQTNLQERFQIRVSEPDRNRPSTMFIPDGWLKTIFVPVHPRDLERLLEWHMSLANDLRLGASIMGEVSFQNNAVNYVVGRCPIEYEDATEIFIRSIETCGTPVLSEAEREVASSGAAAWTIRRSAYLYRCNVFLRDVPYVVESLSLVGLLPTQPDLCAAIAPAELIMVAKEMSWFSPKEECRITWVASPQDPDQISADAETSFTASQDLVREALLASEKYEALFHQVEIN